MAYFKTQLSPEMFDHALKLVDPNSASGKELLKAKRAQIAGDNYAVRRALYKAFDKLPASEKKYVLGVGQKRTIEDQISQLLQTDSNINSSKLKKVDELASKSYDHLQKGGSLMSYRYLLEALDLAESPVSKALVRELLSKSTFNSDCNSKSKSKSKKNQIGGAPVPVVPPIPAGAGVAGLGLAPLPIVIGASTLGIFMIAFIIYTLLERPTQEPPQASDQAPSQPAQIAPDQPAPDQPDKPRPTRNLQRAPVIYGAMPKAKTSQYEKIPRKSSQIDQGVGFIGRPVSDKWSSAPSDIFLSKSVISSESPFQRRSPSARQATSEYGFIPGRANPPNPYGVLPRNPQKIQEIQATRISESGDQQTDQTKDKDRRQLDKYCQDLQKIEESELKKPYYRDYLLEIHKFVRSIVQKYKIDTKNLKPGTDVLDIIMNCEFLRQALE